MAADHLHRLLQERGAWAPATFPQCHQGQSWTYEQKRNGKRIRPDLIAIPLSWRHGQVVSKVEVGIHAGQLAPDHYAVTLAVQATLQSPFARQSEPPRSCRRFDEEAIAKPENRDTVVRILSSIPVVGWNVPASEHACVVVEHLQACLEEHFPLRNQKQGRRHSFLTDATWALHAEVAKLRRACAACRTHTQRHLLASALLAWKAWRHELSLTSTSLPGNARPKGHMRRTVTSSSRPPRGCARRAPKTGLSGGVNDHNLCDRGSKGHMAVKRRYGREKAYDHKKGGPVKFTTPPPACVNFDMPSVSA